MLQYSPKYSSEKWRSLQWLPVFTCTTQADHVLAQLKVTNCTDCEIQAHNFLVRSLSLYQISPFFIYIENLTVMLMFYWIY